MTNFQEINVKRLLLEEAEQHLREVRAILPTNYDALREASLREISAARKLKDDWRNILDVLVKEHVELKKYKESTKQLRKMKDKLNKLITYLVGGEMTALPYEFITGVAIRREGIVYQLPRPMRHGDVIFWMIGQGVPGPIFHEQGFITTKGRFVDRKEGAKIALSSGQIEQLEYSKTDLFSEDLW